MLTPAQLITLNAAIEADSALNSQPMNDDGANAIAIALSAIATPDYWVWRSFVPDAELYEATTADGTTWSWTTFIGRSQGERDAWRQMVNMKGGIAPYLANVRAGIADIFSGAGGAAQRTHLLTSGRRKATRAEQLFATGAGTTAAPSIMGFEGTLTIADVTAAREL